MRLRTKFLKMTRDFIQFIFLNPVSNFISMFHISCTGIGFGREVIDIKLKWILVNFMFVWDIEITRICFFLSSPFNEQRRKILTKFMMQSVGK